MTSRLLYQPQLNNPQFYLNESEYTLPATHLQAKHWIETTLCQTLPDSDLYSCLRNGIYLCLVMDQIRGVKFSYFYGDCPEERVCHFLNVAKQFGLQSSQLFNMNDLLHGEDMDAVASTILILARICSYSSEKKLEKSYPAHDIMTFKQETQHKPPFPTQKKKRFGLLGQQLTGDIKPEKKEYKESSFKEDIVQNDEENIHHSKKESLRIQTQCLDSNTDHLMTPLSFQKEVPYSLEEYARRHSRNTNEDMWGSPFEIKRPNCIPGFSTISLDDLEELPSPIDTLSFGDEEDFGEDIYNTNKSNTPSSSGDSGYGTTRKSSSLSSHRNSRTISGSTRVAEHFHAMFTPEPSKTHPIQSTVTDPDVTPASLSSLFQNSTPTKKKSSSLSARPSQETCVRETKAATLSHKSTRKNRTSSQEWQTTLQRKHEIEKSCRRKERKVSDVPTDHLELRDENNQLVARYKLGNIIGKGHFGTVYRALDLMSGKTVAIKQIGMKDARKQDIDDLMQEASLLESLAHTNIVKYEGFIQTEDYVNVVLEFVENGSLLNTLKNFGNALPEHLVASYCYRILQGLAYLHERDVVHCDLKAANILTTKAGDVKLSDFGVSLNLKLKNDDNVISGTPYWMSPEVIELKGASVQSDIWSLGCTIIELYTGKPPYSNLITMAAMYNIVEDDCPPLPSDISDDFLDFLKLCFKKNPTERPKAAELLFHPWIQKEQNRLNGMAPPTPTATHSLGSHKKRTTQKHKRMSSSMTMSDLKKMPELPKPSQSTLLPTEPFSRRGSAGTLVSSPTSSLQHRSIFAQKVNQKRAADLRQSMPAEPVHKHKLIEGSFPKGLGKCKVCHTMVKNDALVCKDFCGYICHTYCKPNHNRLSTKTTLKSPQLESPKPMVSVSSQLRGKISRVFSRPHAEPLGDIQEDSPTKSRNSWWKKKPRSPRVP